MIDGVGVPTADPAALGTASAQGATPVVTPIADSAAAAAPSPIGPVQAPTADSARTAAVLPQPTGAPRAPNSTRARSNGPLSPAAPGGAGQASIASKNAGEATQAPQPAADGPVATDKAVPAGRAPAFDLGLEDQTAGQHLFKSAPATGGAEAKAELPIMTGIDGGSPSIAARQSAQPAVPGQPVPAAAPAIAVHIAQAAQAGHKRFEIRLDPPELGRIEVRLDVARDGHASTHLVVERAETLDLLQRDARHLERALQNAGLTTGDGGLTFSLKDQGQAQKASAHDWSGGPEKPTEEAETAVEEAQPARRLTSLGLDIRI
jgi:hypothetical protein